MEDNILKELKIEVTYNCPLSCVHCSSEASGENVLVMSQEMCYSIIMQAAKMGVKEIAFSGGEPLVWEGLEKAVELCNNSGVEASIYTSGNCDDIEGKFKRLSEVALKRAVFSIYSAKEEEHICITRKQDSFQKTLKAIAACKKYGIVPEIHFVVLATNYKNLKDIVELAKKLGVERVSALRFVPQGRGALIEKRDTLSTKQNKELVQMIKDIRESGFMLRTGSPFNVLLINEQPRCMAAKDRLIIAPDLSIYPCDAFKQIPASQIVQNIDACSLGTCSLEDCWNNSSYLNKIRKTIDGSVGRACESCGSYKKCLSGCLAQKFLKYNSLLPNRDPACLRIGDSK